MLLLSSVDSWHLVSSYVVAVFGVVVAVVTVEVERYRRFQIIWIASPSHSPLFFYFLPCCYCKFILSASNPIKVLYMRHPF